MPERRVFTPEWIAWLKRKFENDPEYNHPKYFHLFTSDEQQADCDMVEGLVAPLTESEQAKVISRLRSPLLFSDAMNELLVGESFRRLGHALEYEPDIDGLTPDWKVRPASATPFIVDVVASKAPHSRSQRDDKWERFRIFLGDKLKGDAVLSVQPRFCIDDWTLAAPPNDGRHAGIASGAQAWLDSGPEENAVLPFDEFEFDIHFGGRMPAGPGIYCGVGLTPFKVDPDPLKEAIAEKASKYRQIAEKHKLPLVVAVAIEFASGRGFDDVQQASLGTFRCKLVRRPGRPLEQVHYHDQDGLFARYPALSAVSMVRSERYTASHSLLLNPNAIHPISKSWFLPSTPT